MRLESIVRTLNRNGVEVQPERRVDMSRPSTRKWLADHVLWALTAGLGVQVATVETAKKLDDVNLALDRC